MKVLLPLFMLLSLMPVKADLTSINCPGNNTIEMQRCAAKLAEDSNAALEKKLSAKALKQWRKTTQEVCAAAYAPYRKGSIYPQMVTGCNDQLNRALLKEFKGLGD